jgi:hypothetical protein
MSKLSNFNALYMAKLQKARERTHSFYWNTLLFTQPANAPRIMNVHMMEHL